jgi:hypothetical protein
MIHVKETKLGFMRVERVPKWGLSGSIYIVVVYRFSANDLFILLQARKMEKYLESSKNRRNDKKIKVPTV